jgi:hypothetical protein
VFEAGDDSDLMAWYSAARAEIQRDRSLTREQKASKKSALKAQRQIRKCARKANRAATKLRATRTVKAVSKDAKP